MKRSHQTRQLSAKTPWRAPVRDPQTGHVVAFLGKKRTALTSVYTVRGLDSIGDDPETIGARMLQANRALQNLRGPWTLQPEAQRSRFITYPLRQGRFVVPQLVEEDRQQTCCDPQTGLWLTRYFLAITWEPPLGTQRVREYFLNASAHFMEHLRPVLADMRRLEDEELYAACKSTVSLRWTTPALPMPQTDIGQYLVDGSWQAGRYPEWDARLGDQHVRVLSLTGYPRTTTATMMLKLEALGIPLRYATRWQEIAPYLSDRELMRRQEEWISNKVTFAQRVNQTATGKETEIFTEDAFRKTEDLGLVRQDIGGGFVGLGVFTPAILTWAATAARAEDQAQTIRQTLEALGFVVRREGDYGARSWLGGWLLSRLAPPHHTAAFLGAMFGNTTDNARRALQTTLSMTHLFPGLGAVFAGPDRDEHLGEGPWFHAQTETSSVRRIVHHVGDVGHSLYLGNTGSGKSTTIGFQMMQWLMYKTTRGALFDVGRSARGMTLLCGGRWLDLGAAQLQPLRDIHDQAEFRWCLEWLLGLCVRGKIEEKNGVVQEYLSERLTELLGQSPDERTLSRLLHGMEAHSNRVEPNAYKRRDRDGLARPDDRMLDRHGLYRAVQRVLRPFTRAGGAYGTILDGVQPTLLDSHLVTFELAGLAKTPRALEAVSQYCFHLTERRFDTQRPMWIVMEEAPLLATLPNFREQADTWLMTIRKAGGSLALVINSLRQQAEQLTSVLSDENAPTRWYFPNEEALTPEVGQLYDQFGLTRAEKTLIATMRHKDEVYYVSRRHGRRRLSLRLSPFIVDCVGRNTDADHALFDRLLAQEGPEGFAAAYFRHRGYDAAAQRVAQGGPILAAAG